MFHLLNKEVKKDGYEGAVFLNSSIKRQLDFWIQRLKENCRRELVDFSKPDTILTVDSSPWACGATLAVGGDRFHFLKKFNSSTKNQTSSFKEFLEVLFALNNYSLQITQNHVGKILLRSNCTNVENNINRWGAQVNLRPLFIKIMEICQSVKLTMIASHILGWKNTTADELLRLEGIGDYMTRCQCLNEAERALEGKAEIDAIANEGNKRKETLNVPGVRLLKMV
ncbi:uncharacterized protein MONOS_9382 [Monocercomonoides exilis]|uniref:uncharacterized protein n=1 Tax=Monocercomonoides exilis TaxID=2049356 RepID=UPI003559C483|nr:hypothetical protein MONOS_9382 [Monocercomonoides exilis]|eukprot:MONOS_9382.1-p1 / transcript=MONOS_9382.1 / gene=MONOS_9382 / organism=Monocercomonoides_exilis_PA203 / gene_product=unspecified product / transcript_product=unspecified product / location=Mono_scaffold00385:51464-52141(+) / protein_length=226 / sequence_SO=supercontig / SO=protein_coding / is_pseudo=false